MNIPDLRPSPIAGTWYEGNPKALARRVDEYLDAAVLPPLEGRVVGLISPHAGHVYSGGVAGHAFAAVRGQSPDLVAVVSPFHNYLPHPLITTAHQAYATPLGAIPVDRTALGDLQARLEAPITAVARDREHSLEIELPFLQRALAGEFKLLPLMVRAQDPRMAEQLGAALAAVLAGRDALLVASTDLSHFFDQVAAERLDAEMLRRFESFDPNSIFEAEHAGRGFACGHSAVAAVLWAARGLGADRVRILRHATSGDVTGDRSSVVGYGAAAILQSRG